MDDPDLDPALHAAALRGLRRINRWTGSARPIAGEITRLAKTCDAASLSVLDVGCGGGDVVTGLGLRVYPVPVRFAGCDRSRFAVHTANGHAASVGVPVRFFEHDVLAGPIPGTYDIVMCSLFLHHFERPEAVCLVGHMRAAARHLVLIDDLCRTRRGYRLAWIGCRLLSRSPVVHVDGPRSVEAAWTPVEARAIGEEAGLESIRIRRHWPERFTLTARCG